MHPEKKDAEMKGILRFALPMVAAAFLQILFKEAGLAVAGRLCGDIAVSVIGSTSAVSSMILNATVALAVGVNTTAALINGEGSKEKLYALIKTWMYVFGITGMVVGGLLICGSRALIVILGTPPSIVDAACVYFRLFCLGIPAILLFQCGSAMFRGTGDTVTPLKCQLVSGIFNILLDIALLKWLKMGTIGVAVAGAISQYLSLGLIMSFKKKRFNDRKAEREAVRTAQYEKSILNIGIPACLQSILFSASNLTLQTAINNFGIAAIAGNSAASSVQTIVDSTMSAFELVALSLVGSHVGAGRITKIGAETGKCLICVVVIGSVAGGLVAVFPEWALQLYVHDAESVYFGIIRIRIVCTCMALCGMTEVLTGVLRGMGNSRITLLITLAAGCGLRMLWTRVVIKNSGDFSLLMLSYPVSWVATMLLMLLAYVLIKRKLMLKQHLTISNIN